jgi:hypothetical protein
MIEGVLYLFSLAAHQDKATVSEAVELALESSKCGRVLGSGISLSDECTLSIEMAASDPDFAEEVVSRCCRKLECRDFEIVWD